MMNLPARHHDDDLGDTDILALRNLQLSVGDVSTKPQSDPADIAAISGQIEVVPTYVHARPRTATTFFEPDELPDPSRVQSQGGTREWRLHTYPCTRAERIITIVQIEHQLRSASPALHAAKFVVEVLKSSYKDPCHVKAVFHDSAAYNDAGKAALVWRNRPVELACSVAPIAAGHTVLKINHLSVDVDLSEVVNTFEKRLESQVEFLDVWGSWIRYRWKDGNPGVEDQVYLPKTHFAGALLILAKYKNGCGPNDIPGYLQYGGVDLYLHFKGRVERCHFCIGVGVPLHSASEPRWLRRYRCKARGHFGKDCPEIVKAKEEGTVPVGPRDRSYRGSGRCDSVGEVRSNVRVKEDRE